MMLNWLIALLLAVHFGGPTYAVGVDLRSPLQCEGDGVDPWVQQVHNRVVSSDRLVAYATRIAGPPISCEGAVTAEFDGAKFGRLLLGFAGGVSFELQTSPPETFAVVLRAPAGVFDETSARQELDLYASALGLKIEWTTPEETVEEDTCTERFSDPDPGVNGSASLIFRQDMLVELRLSVAL